MSDGTDALDRPALPQADTKPLAPFHRNDIPPLKIPELPRPELMIDATSGVSSPGSPFGDLRQTVSRAEIPNAAPAQPISAPEQGGPVPELSEDQKEALRVKGKAAAGKKDLLGDASNPGVVDEAAGLSEKERGFYVTAWAEEMASNAMTRHFAQDAVGVEALGEARDFAAVRQDYVRLVTDLVSIRKNPKAPEQPENPPVV